MHHDRTSMPYRAIAEKLVAPSAIRLGNGKTRQPTRGTARGCRCSHERICSARALTVTHVRAEAKSRFSFPVYVYYPSVYTCKRYWRKSDDGPLFYFQTCQERDVSLVVAHTVRPVNQVPDVLRTSASFISFTRFSWHRRYKASSIAEQRRR